MAAITAVTLPLSLPVSVEEQRYFDNDLADRYELFFPELLQITEGDQAGEPFLLAEDPWRNAIREVMGWRVKKDGRRWYRQLYIYIPRKNGKTTTIAGLVLAIPIIEPEARGQILIVAATEEQAKILFDHARAFIAASPVLQEIYFSGAEEIEHVATGTKIKFISGNELGKVGTNPSVIIVDELQEQTKPDLLAKLVTGTGTRKQPLSILIGTRGAEDDTQDVYWVRWLKKAERTLENPASNPKLLPIVYQTDEEADPGDPDTWFRANPTLGTVLDFDTFAGIWEDMKDDPAERAFFCQYHLNMKRAAYSEAVDLKAWLGLVQSFTEKDLKGRPAFAGLDLGLTSDMTGLGLLFPFWVKVKYKDDRGKTQLAWHVTFKQLEYYWTCQAAVDASEKKVFRYAPLVEQGWIRIAGNKVMDYNQIGSEVAGIFKQFKVQACGYDRYQAHEMAPRLAKERINMVAVPQTSMSLSAPYVRHKEMIAAGDIVHRGNPMFAENLRNARVTYDKKQNPVILKAENNRKIDGYAAVLDAVRVFMDTPEQRPIEV